MAWDYPVTAFGVPVEDQEKLREHIIAQFGEKLKLIAPPEKPRAKRVSQRRKRRKSRQ